jgi:transcriptional regulator with XRE-family HTH domain
VSETAGLNREAISEIERMMREKGYSRSDLSRLLKVSRVTVTQMLRPQTKFSLTRLERIARKMGYTVHLSVEKQIDSRYRDNE